MRPFGLSLAPGTVGGASFWTPDTLAADLDIWFDAADAATITQAGGAVSQWDDKSGNDRHATQTTAAYQPQYSATGLSGQPALLFDSSALQASISTQDNVDFSLAIVFDAAVNTGSSGLAVQTSRNTLFQGAGGDWRSFTGAVNLSVGANGAWLYLLSIDYGATSRLRRAGASTSTPTIAGTTQTGSLMLIGSAAVPPTTSLTGDVPVAEIILFNRALTLAECETVEGYLAHKWDFADQLPGGHPYKAAAPTE